MESEVCLFERIENVEDTIGEIHRKLQLIDVKLERIIEGPIFRTALNQISSVQENCDRNSNALNTMMLQLKGVLSQMNSIRGKKSDWDGEEILNPGNLRLT